MRTTHDSPPSMPILQGMPGFADNQRHRILELLRQAGPAGVSRSDLIFQHRFTQCGTRIFELEKMGYVIRHETKPGHRYVTYFLESEPVQEERPQPTDQPTGADPRQRTFANSPDWYERETRKHRPVEQPQAKDLPLFDQP